MSWRTAGLGAGCQLRCRWQAGIGRAIDATCPENQSPDNETKICQCGKGATLPLGDETNKCIPCDEGLIKTSVGDAECKSCTQASTHFTTSGQADPNRRMTRITNSESDSTDHGGLASCGCTEGYYLHFPLANSKDLSGNCTVGKDGYRLKQLEEQNATFAHETRLVSRCGVTRPETLKEWICALNACQRLGA